MRFKDEFNHKSPLKHKSNEAHEHYKKGKHDPRLKDAPKGTWITTEKVRLHSEWIDQGERSTKETKEFVEKNISKDMRAYQLLKEKKRIEDELRGQNPLTGESFRPVTPTEFATFKRDESGEYVYEDVYHAPVSRRKKKKYLHEHRKDYDWHLLTSKQKELEKKARYDKRSKKHYPEGGTAYMDSAMWLSQTPSKPGFDLSKLFENIFGKK